MIAAALYVVLALCYEIIQTAANMLVFRSTAVGSYCWATIASTCVYCVSDIAHQKTYLQLATGIQSVTVLLHTVLKHNSINDTSVYNTAQSTATTRSAIRHSAARISCTVGAGQTVLAHLGAVLVTFDPYQCVSADTSNAALTPVTA
jgi:hypothetical protein